MRGKVNFLVFEQRLDSGIVGKCEAGDAGCTRVKSLDSRGLVERSSRS